MIVFIALVGFIIAGGGFLMLTASLQSICAFPVRNIFLSLVALALMAGGIWVILQREMILKSLLR
ncbi:MAG TPA: hypothetical protein PKW42_12150 [bacterium]|nr:hypothetical protein [bacterium]HPP13471.1 hypothetical protein [bacterium]